MWYWRETREKLLLAGVLADVVLIVLINLRLPVWPIFSGSWVGEVICADATVKIATVLLMCALFRYVYYCFFDLVPRHSLQSFGKYAEQMRKDARLVMNRRENWAQLDIRVRQVYDELNAPENSEIYGALYFINVPQHEALKNVDVTRRLNHIQVSSGFRRLGLNGVEYVKEDMEAEGVDKSLRRTRKILHEENQAAIWFTQTPSGGVTVFMSPYKSSLSSLNEKEIIIGFYHDPAKLTKRKVRILFSFFFKYMSISSALHNQTILNYAWRLWLIFLDVRTRKLSVITNRVFNLIVFGAALAGVLTYVLATAKP
nr:hypothetical protein [Pseudomonas juntendi]